MVTDLGESGVKGREKINKNAIVYIISHTWRERPSARGKQG